MILDLAILNFFHKITSAIKSDCYDSDSTYRTYQYRLIVFYIDISYGIVSSKNNDFFDALRLFYVIYTVYIYITVFIFKKTTINKKTTT